MTNETRGEEAYNLHRKIAQIEQKRRELYQQNLLNLAKMYHKGYYKDYLGDQSAPWSAYLAEIEVYYTRNQVRDFLRIYKKYIEDLQLKPEIFIDIPRGRLIDMIPVLNYSNYIDWLTRARTLTTRDWKIELRKTKGLPTPEDEHEHSFKTYDICSICGEKKSRHA